MWLSRKKVFLTGLLLLLAAVLSVVMTIGYSFLPSYLETKIIPKITKTAGISEYAVSIRDVGFFGSDLGALRIGPPENPAVVIQSVQIDYSPIQLYQENIVERIVLSGIQLYGNFHNGRFRLQNLDLEEIMAKRTPGKEKALGREKRTLPISVGGLEIRNAVFICEFNQQTYRIPFEIDMLPEDKDFTALDISARLYPRGQKVSAAARIDLLKETSSVELNAAGLDAERFADLVGHIAHLSVSGEIDMKGNISIQLKPFHVSSAAVEFKLNESRIVYKSFLLENALNKDREVLPFILSVQKTNLNQWDITGSSVSASAPLPIILSEFDSTLSITEDAIKSSGSIKAELNPSFSVNRPSLALSILEPMALKGKFTAELDRNGNWQFNLNNRTAKTGLRNSTKIRINEFVLASKVPTIHVSGNRNEEQVSVNCNVVIPHVQVKSPSASVEIPQLNLTGSTNYNPGPEEDLTADFSFSFPEARGTLDSARVAFNNASFSGNIKQDGKQGYFLSSMLSLADVKFQDLRQDIKITNAHIDFPMQWPPRMSKKSGTFSVSAVQYRNLELGGVSGKLHQVDSGVTFEGKHSSKLFPPLVLVFDGNSDIYQSGDPGLELRFTVTGKNRTTEIALGKFAPAAGGITIGGNIEAQGELRLRKVGLNGTVRTELNNGKLNLPEHKIAVEGIEMSLELPHLPQIRSAPKQIIRFTSASMGELVIESGHIECQLESPNTVFIEKSHFGWCDGEADVPAIRITPGKDDYNITLYCDRLNLAKVLEQFGVASAEGKGTVNGKLPIIYKNGKLRFDDGFLFSTPGEGGKIRLKAIEKLTAGIPENTPQYVQMELAREALKDYDYSWAKLNLTTEGETFLLRLQFDGKPAGLLPFVYKKEIGGFSKVEAGGKGSHFQGIRLDVNFRLPLNRILHYKDIVNMIQ